MPGWRDGGIGEEEEGRGRRVDYFDFSSWLGLVRVRGSKRGRGRRPEEDEKEEDTEDKKEEDTSIDMWSAPLKREVRKEGREKGRRCGLGYGL